MTYRFFLCHLSGSPFTLNVVDPIQKMSLDSSGTPPGGVLVGSQAYILIDTHDLNVSLGDIRVIITGSSHEILVIFYL